MSYAYRGSYKKWKIHSIVMLVSILIFFGGFIWLFFGHYSVIVKFDNKLAFGLLVFTLVLIVPLIVSLVQVCCKLIKKNNYIWNYKTAPYNLAVCASFLGTVFLIAAFILLFKIHSLTMYIAFALSLIGTLTTTVFGFLITSQYKNI